MGKGTMFLLEPGHSLQVLANDERDLKVELIRVRIPLRATPRRGLSRVELTAIVSDTARTLERTLALAGFTEAVHELGLGETDVVRARMDELRQRARANVGIDPIGALQEVDEWARTQPATHAGPQDWGSTLDAVMSSARSLVAAIPIDDVVAMATIVECPQEGHRTRLAYEALRAFVRRTDPAVQASTKAAGRAYAQGRLTLAEVGLLLGLTPSDAVALLEEKGFSRTVDTIRLTDVERAERMARVRADRLQRQGAPVPAPGLVDREVVATQRIEGVDARPWIAP